LELRGGGGNDEVEQENDDDDDDKEEVEHDDEDEMDDDGSPSTGMDYAAVVQQVVDVTKTKVIPVLVTASKKTYQLISQVTLSTYHAIQRAMKAAIDDDEDEDLDEKDEFEVTMADQALKLVLKIAKTIKRMVVAALDFSNSDAMIDDQDDDDDDDDNDADTLVIATKNKVKSAVKKEVTEEAIENDDVGSETREQPDIVPTTLDNTLPQTDQRVTKDFGSTLAELYDVIDGREANSNLVVMGGSFKDALDTARKEARLLLVFIPAERPNGGRRFLFGGKKKETDGPSKDKIAIKSLLSPQVAKAANRQARKKGSDSGSFVVWAARVASSEANIAIKQLKVQTTKNGENVPILAAVYPAYVSVGCSVGCILPPPLPPLKTC
jgi:hypothetical protein